MDFPIVVDDVRRLGILVTVAAFSVIVHAQDPGGQRPPESCKGAYNATKWSTSSTAMPDGSVKVITEQADFAQSSSGQLRMAAHARSDGSERKIQPITRVQILDWKNHSFIMLFPSTHIATKSPLPSMSSTDQVSLPKLTKTNLGSKRIDGISVTGERDVFTSMESSGPNGSPRKVTHTFEFWSNKEMCLTMEVSTRDSNNSNGHSEMTNVVTAEPAAALFEIPAGYTLANP